MDDRFGPPQWQSTSSSSQVFTKEKKPSCQTAFLHPPSLARILPTNFLTIRLNFGFMMSTQASSFALILIVYVQDDLKVVTTEKSINLGQVSLKENAFNMCLNGGTFYPGTGCLCIDNYSGDFCDECLPGWIGEKCDNPENMCETTSDSINCYGKWLFNLTLLDMPIGAKELGSIDLGSMGRKVLKDISILKDILLKDIRLPCIRCTHVVIS